MSDEFVCNNMQMWPQNSSYLSAESQACSVYKSAGENKNSTASLCHNRNNCAPVLVQCVLKSVCVHVCRFLCGTICDKPVLPNKSDMSQHQVTTCCWTAPILPLNTTFKTSPISDLVLSHSQGTTLVLCAVCVCLCDFWTITHCATKKKNQRYV